MKLSFLSFILPLALSACTQPSMPDGPGVSSLASSAMSAVSSAITAAQGCKIGGCSGELCLDANSEDMASICIYKEEFACYKSARCEKQASGGCGWTQTAELQACIANAQASGTSDLQ